MATKHGRVFGTSDEAIALAERELGRRLPPSFRAWLLQNNGRDLHGVSIFPVRDERDVRKTWDSIVRNYTVGWQQWQQNFADEGIRFDHLLPFADFGTGDYYCFDYSELAPDGETPVVLWSHETGETEPRGSTFLQFAEALSRGDFEHD